MYVDGNNCLRIVDTHFYGTKDAPFGNGIDMSTICIYLHYMFDGYRRVKEYAIYKKVKIYNLTLTSFIDSFEKTKSLI